LTGAKIIIASNKSFNQFGPNDLSGYQVISSLIPNPVLISQTLGS